MMIIEDDDSSLNQDFSLCEERTESRPAFCGCFTKQFQPKFVKSSKVENFLHKKGHWWISDKVP